MILRMTIDLSSGSGETMMKNLFGTKFACEMSCEIPLRKRPGKYFPINVSHNCIEILATGELGKGLNWVTK